jgi:hypothetical protein
MFVLIGLSAPSPGARGPRRVRRRRDEVARPGRARAAEFPGRGPGRRAARSRSARCRSARKSASSFGAEYHDGTKRTVATLATLDVAFVLTTAFVHVAA